MTWVGMQMYGPNVAPLTIGKQNLISYVLRQLEKHFYVVNQFFRVAECSHSIQLQQATATLVIVTHSEITDVGLDTVSHAVCYHLACFNACIVIMLFTSKLDACMCMCMPSVQVSQHRQMKCFDSDHSMAN